MIPLPKQPRIVEKKGNWTKFEIEGLYPGYGVTLGNTLRRVLLSSLEGTAVIQAKIKGVQHEFSTIPGVLEDVITILLNLKQLRFKLHTQEPQTATLKVKGERKVSGSDLELPSQLELVNKGVHIATITDRKGEIEMEILVDKGFGYEPAEKRKKEKLPIGVISIDAIYTPVRKVSYRVENMRVGDRTDFDHLFLELETDGTITPEEAIFRASEIVSKHFSLFESAFQPKEPASSASLADSAGKEARRTSRVTKKHAKKKKGKKTK